MLNINTNPTKTCHVHVHDFDTAVSLVACLCLPEEIVEYDAERSKCAGCTIQIVTLDRHDPDATTATIYHLDHRLVVNNLANGATTCIWWDEH